MNLEGKGNAGHALTCTSRIALLYTTGGFPLFDADATTRGFNHDAHHIAR